MGAVAIVAEVTLVTGVAARVASLAGEVLIGTAEAITAGTGTCAFAVGCRCALRGDAVAFEVVSALRALTIEA